MSLSHHGGIRLVKKLRHQISPLAYTYLPQSYKEIVTFFLNFITVEQKERISQNTKEQSGLIFNSKQKENLFQINIL